MNPVNIYIFDVNNSSRTDTNHFYYMCLTQGVDCAIVASIFASTEEKFIKRWLTISLRLEIQVLWSESIPQPHSPLRKSLKY